jgi:hypothetical protein
MGKAQTPFTYYTFRFDINWQIESSLLNQIKNYIISEFPKYSIFQEISDETKKPHIQGIIGKALSRQQIIKNIKKSFKDVFVGSNHSIADITDFEKYKSYICKSNNIFVNNYFEQSEIDKYNEEYKIIENQIVDNGSKIKKSKSKTFLQKVVYEFNNQFSEHVEIIHYYHIYNWKLTEDEVLQAYNSKVILFRHLMKMLGSSAKIFDSNMLQRMYNGIYNSIIQQHEDAAKHYVDKLMESLSL